MNAAERWRVVDTGLREPRQNAALDRALLEAREADEIAPVVNHSDEELVMLEALVGRRPPFAGTRY